MLLIIAMATVVVVGIAAIALAEPRREASTVPWSDDTERQMLRERSARAGWW